MQQQCTVVCARVAITGNVQSTPRIEVDRDSMQMNEQRKSNMYYVSSRKHS